MADFLFYKNWKNEDLFGKTNLPDQFQLLNSSITNCQLLSSSEISNIYHLKNERIDFFIIGNVTFYKNFKVNLENLIINDKLNTDELTQIFRNINGIYCGIIFNKKSNDVKIISDHLGFYPLYFYHDSELTVFSSETKYFNLFKHTNLTLNEHAIYSYLHNGHIMLDQSWFQQVCRTRPASIYTLNLNNGNLSNEYYWSWSSVKKLQLPNKELIKKYATLFTKGIENLDLPEDSINGLSLSGGLDSRWIGQVAAKNFDINAFTFSTSINYETQLAEEVAKTLNLKHQTILIDKSNWLKNRLDAFWKLDGMLHLGHLHEGNIYKDIHASFSHCFHGFYGGGIYGSTKECNLRITNAIAKLHFNVNDSDLKTEDPFYNTQCIDPYFVDQKIRYQSAYSMYLLSTYSKMIIPFYYMDWLEFNYSIDDKLQLNSKFYLEALKENLNTSLLKIPWQRTGLAPKNIRLNNLFLKYKIPSISEFVQQRLHSSRHFINYHYFDAEIDHWLNEFKSEISNLQINYPLITRERKLRMLSLVIWLKMNSKMSPDVL